MQPIARDTAPPFYTFDLLSRWENITHALFSRHGGVSLPPYASLNVSASIGDDPAAVLTNRDRVLAALGRPRASLVMAGLVHGIDVARVNRTTAGIRLDSGGRYIPGVDALITNDPAVTLVVTAADCAQVFFVDPVHAAVGLAHAGWRGTANGILTATVTAMRDHFDSNPRDLYSAIGPCLGPCCARFSDPYNELPSWCAPFIRDRYVDLWSMNRQQLLGAGLLPEHISLAGICTVCRRDLFFSHRGDGGRTGRFAAAIGVR